MMTTVRIGLTLGLLWILAGPLPAATATPTPPPKESDYGFIGDSRGAVLAKLKRVGLIPALPTPGFEERTDIEPLLESAVTAGLRKAGIEVVGPESYKASLQKFSRQVGGLYDPMTGAPRSQQIIAVGESARREFLETEHLDGFVTMRIISAKAQFQHEYANWDFVNERTDGRVVTNILSEIAHDMAIKGTLPAYSLAIWLLNPEYKTLFVRQGGIQLAAYYNPGKNKENNNFQLVPNDLLFRDAKRMDRAVAVVALPLQYPIEEVIAKWQDPAFNPARIKLADLPPPPAASAPLSESPLKLGREQILASVHRVVVTPVNPGDFKVPAELSAQYQALIHTELKDLNWELIDSDQAIALLGKAVIGAGGLFDPLTGALNNDRAHELRMQVFSELGITPAPDAMLWLQLIRRGVQHHLGNAQWDGVNQSAIDLGPARTKGLFGGGNFAIGDGVAKAVSLRVQLRDAKDTVLYDSSGGIQLLQQFQGDKLTDLAPAELFKDTSRAQPAVHAALRDLTMTPAQIDQELHPKP